MAINKTTRRGLAMEQHNIPGSLMVKTLTLSQADKRDLLSIHKDTNLPLYWLREFRAGRIKNPSVNRIQSLYEHYTGKPLLGN
jgi:hypothetical protein